MPRRTVPPTEVTVNESNVTPTPVMNRVDLRTISMSIDNLMCNCDHTTYMAKVLGPEDESGERPEITVGKICVKKKTWFFTEIKHVAVREEYRRQGIAKHMINHLLADNDEYGEKIVHTLVVGGTVSIENLSMISLLTSMRFTLGITFTNPETNNTLSLMLRTTTI